MTHSLYLLLAVLSLTLAGCGEKPDQLDILGLVPGVSELTQVQQVDAYPYRDLEVKAIDPGKGLVLRIGGYTLPCTATFLKGKLFNLFCFTGTNTGQYSQPELSTESNTEMHPTLTAGFTKKFGNPDSVKTVPARTKMGVEYETQNVIWRDKRGNELHVISIFNQVDRGLITLMSFEYINQAVAKGEANEAQQKF